jgi:hypothetical protein
MVQAKPSKDDASAACVQRNYQISNLASIHIMRNISRDKQN